MCRPCRRMVRLDRRFANGDNAGYVRWFTGCPVRAMAGGVGGNRLLLMVPEPASWATWLTASSNLRNVNRASLAEVDKSDDPSGSLAQRAKQVSAGGKMAVHPPKTSRQRRVKDIWSPKSAKARKVGPMVDGVIMEEQ